MEPIPNTVKIIPLLAQYLYTHKRLDLPGIGSFALDPQAVVEQDNPKRPLPLPPIQFTPLSAAAPVDPELISYISLHSGKMKALALSDIESHIELALQFLNIGKPFLFEGIGTVIKKDAGTFEFVPGQVIQDKSKPPVVKEERKAEAEKNTSPGYDSFLPARKKQPALQRPLIGLLLLAGLGLAIYAGYYISKRNKSGSSESTESAAVTPPVTPDTTTQTQQKDTTAQQDTIPPVPLDQPRIDMYKYVLEVAPAKRAFTRYNQLKSYQWNVEMETNDSIRYKLFVMLPAIAADTTHILDSLTVYTGKRVYIEYRN